MKQDKSISMILYSNLDHYPPTVNALKILENEYKVVIFSRNVSYSSELFSEDSMHYRLGKHASVQESESKSALLKLLEYILFTFKSIHYMRLHKCYIVIAYDPYSFVTARVLQLINHRVKIFYHAHELITLGTSKWNNLRFWMEKITLKNMNKCVWVSQADIKRKDVYSQITSLKDIKVMRNFALKNYRLIVNKHPSIEQLRNDGYAIAVYTGMISDYIDDLVRYVDSSDLKIAIYIAGNFRDKKTGDLLRNHNNNNTIAKIFYLGFLARNELYALLNSADFAIVLYKSSWYLNMGAGACTKVGGYLACGLPVIYPSFWNYEPYYKEIGVSYSDGTELIQKIEEMSKNKKLRSELSKNINKLFNKTLHFEYEFRPFKVMIDKYMKLKP